MKLVRLRTCTADRQSHYPDSSVESSCCFASHRILAHSRCLQSLSRAHCSEILNSESGKKGFRLSGVNVQPSQHVAVTIIENCTKMHVMR